MSRWSRPEGSTSSNVKTEASSKPGWNLGFSCLHLFSTLTPVLELEDRLFETSYLHPKCSPHAGTFHPRSQTPTVQDDSRTKGMTSQSKQSLGISWVCDYGLLGHTFYLCGLKCLHCLSEGRVMQHTGLSYGRECRAIFGNWRGGWGRRCFLL